MPKKNKSPKSPRVIAVAAAIRHSVPVDDEPQLVQLLAEKGDSYLPQLLPVLSRLSALELQNLIRSSMKNYTEMQSAPVESLNVDNKKVLLARLNLMTYLMEASKYHDEFRDNNMAEVASAPIPKTVPENRSDDDKIASTSADQHASTSRDQRTSTSENNEEPMETDALMPSTLAVEPAQFPVSSSASTSAFVSTTDRSTMVTQSASSSSAFTTVFASTSTRPATSSTPATYPSTSTEDPMSTAAISNLVMNPPPGFPAVKTERVKKEISRPVTPESPVFSDEEPEVMIIGVVPSVSNRYEALANNPEEASSSFPVPVPIVTTTTTTAIL